MSEYDNQTICALATAPGGALAVIRLSGNEALSTARCFWHSDFGGELSAPTARKLLLGHFNDEKNQVLDSQCLAVYMPGPHSYTGEDVVEFHLHGGVLSARLVLTALQSHPGVRGAGPGEFTRRAFLNGKMDLTQAEAVVEMLQSESQAALRQANRQLSGELRQGIDAFFNETEAILAEVDARVDFPEEDIDWSETQALCDRIQRLSHDIQRLSETVREGEVLRHGVTLVIAGPPNVGKSSLLNRLLGRDRAIVSAIPGTTRDTIEAELVLRDIPFHLVDTAGIHPTDDAIEQSGIERAQTEAAQAEIVLWIMDATQDTHPTPPNVSGKLIQVLNKVDVALPSSITADIIPVSAKTGDGMTALADALENAALGGLVHHAGEQGLTVSSRHASLLNATHSALLESLTLLTNQEWELAAIPLRNARQAMGEITGRSVSPDLLDNIFHRFCIGK